MTLNRLQKFGFTERYRSDLLRSLRFAGEPELIRGADCQTAAMFSYLSPEAFRCFVGLLINASVWDVTVFTKNRDRLLERDIALRFLAAILVDPQLKSLLSDEHFSVDGHHD